MVSLGSRVLAKEVLSDATFPAPVGSSGSKASYFSGARKSEYSLRQALGFRFSYFPLNPKPETLFLVVVKSFRQGVSV